MKILFILVTLMFLSFNPAKTKTVIATVLKLKGKATKLLPGDKKATIVKKGDGLYEDSSIVTKRRSFVAVRFSDGSTMNIGPKSKVNIIRASGKKTGIISLLTGRIRTEIKKRKGVSNQNKMIIKTRTAALGVRGTDFQTIYNSSNKVTSLVTFEGEVALKKIPEAVPSNSAQLKQLSPKDLSNTKKLNSLLNSVDSVTVKKGRYSGVSEAVKSATKPVKISPKQYVALKENVELAESSDKVITDFDSKVKQAVKEINRISDNAVSKSVIDAGFRAGGVVDLNTGLYVGPSADANFNSDTEMFELSEKLGTISHATGAYIPPAGVALTASNGFVPLIDLSDEDLKNATVGKSDSDKKVSDDQVEKLNEKVVAQVKVKKVEELEDKVTQITPVKKEKKTKWWWNNIEKHTLRVALGPHMETFKATDLNPNEFNSGERYFDTDSGGGIELYWAQKWNKKIESYLQLGSDEIVLQNKDGASTLNTHSEDDRGDDYSRTLIGINYSFTEKLYLGVAFVSDNFPLIMLEDCSGCEMSEFVDRGGFAKSLLLSLGYKMGGDNFRGFIAPGVTITKDSTDESDNDSKVLEMKGGFGYQVEGGFDYRVFSSAFIGFKGRYFKNSGEVHDSGSSPDWGDYHHDLKYTRSGFTLRLAFTYEL